jgi:hypothetical protein
MSRSQGAAPARKGGGAIVTTRASILDAPDEPAIGDRRDSLLVDFKVGQSEGHRSFWESPQRGAVQFACARRAGMGGRVIWNGVRDGPVMDRNGRPCTTDRAARKSSKT